ncbi:MAG: FHA domain-containing protein, partial [Myxococcota bacterium]
MVQDRPGRTWSSDAGVVTVGSGDGMTIRGGRGVLEPHHATIHVQGGQVLAVAEGEAEIEHNGEPVTFAVVRPPDVLQVGPLTLKARLHFPHRPGAPRPAPPQAPQPLAYDQLTPLAPPPREGGAKMGIRLPDGRTRTIDLPDGRFLIGSGKANLRIPGLVDQHAEIGVIGSRLELTALDGPLQVGSRATSKVLLRPGTVARIGDVEIWLEPFDAVGFVEPEADEPTVAGVITGSEPQWSASPPVDETTAGSTVDVMLSPVDAPPPWSPEAEPTDPTPVPRTESTTRLPTAVPKHPDDEDYDDELDFVEPFDLAGTFRALPTGKARGGPCVAAIVSLHAGRVRDLGIVEQGET